MNKFLCARTDGARSLSQASVARALLALLLLLPSMSLAPGLQAQEQPIRGGEREEARAMLRDIEDDLKANYYDPSFHGVNFQQHFQEAEDQIMKATSRNQTFGIIAWALEGLHDSHTYFVPPPRPFHLEYGWRATAYGDNCFITAVKPGSDAEKQGLALGDQLLSLNGVPCNRETLHRLVYVFFGLRPQPALELKLRNSAGEERTLRPQAEISNTKRVITVVDFGNEIREAESSAWLMRRRSVEVGDVMISKLPTFMLDEKAADALTDSAKKYKGLILDLRGNPGGELETLVRLVEDVSNQEVKIADLKSRTPQKPLVAKGRGIFIGKLVVLVDSGSASASEIFARAIQLEKRGIILGDRSSGLVMESSFEPHHLGISGPIIFFGVSVTRADLIMSDGQSLEGRGVIPDELLLPTPSDLANMRDPVLSRAAQLAGTELTPEQAGKLFPTEWRHD